MKFDEIKKLHQKKYRQALGYCLIEGEHLVQELEKACTLHPALAEAELYVSEAYTDFPSPWPKHLLNERQMASLSETKTPQGIIALVPLVALQALNTAPIQSAIYLHEIQDPGNLGTILRSLAWFGGMRCLLSPGSVDPYNSKVIRASMGAIFHVPIELDVELTSLSHRFQKLAYLDMQGRPIADPSFAKCDCYIFGNEARGVPHQALASLQAQAYTIPGSGLIESLNLGTAVSLSLYQRQGG
ncbi:TrmH family RNA methyltransferase [Nitrincola tapanii]|uniref:RNA methyltransferase n=1 Tax=Nitrincola tapanii TaxID=1708751 RepID=A0A5A9W5D7_9GAMM|nr:RNA methyltransferase [Nitrincola tapanii]KAA0875289.1 RNA methyltransferase [Nitrincola tapanii]